MLKLIVRKEILEQILSIRFAILTTLAVLLVPFSIYINYRYYQLRRQTAEQLDILTRQDNRRPYMIFRDELSERFKVIYPPSSLSVLAAGLEPDMPLYISVTSTGTKPSVTSSSQSLGVSLFGYLDALFVVEVVFGLLAVLLTFDALTAEREHGTLKLMMANSIPRDTIILGKYLGSYLVLVGALMIGMLLGLITLSLLGFLTTQLVLRSGLAFGMFMLYLSVLCCLGLFVSTSTRSSQTALVVGILLWGFWILVWPKVGYMVAEFSYPVPSPHEVYLEKQLVREDLERQKGEELEAGEGKFYRWVGDARYKSFRIPIAQRYEKKIKEALMKIDREYDRAKRRQEYMGHLLSRLSPAACLRYAVTNVTDTGIIRRDAYLLVVKNYASTLEDGIFRHVWIDKTKENVQGGSDGLELPMALYPVPQAIVTRVQTIGISILPDVAILVLLNIIFFMVAYVRFLRYNVA
jgi:ABC-type transport system involved in multi-copper enzyme maturation permease subunit